MNELTVLRERVRDLSDRVSAVELGLTDHVADLMLQGFTRSEAIVLGLLLTRRAVSRDAMMVGLYGNLSDGDEHGNTVSVFVCKLRKKLREEHGVEETSIRTVHGEGYTIPDAARSHIREALEWKHPMRQRREHSL